MRYKLLYAVTFVSSNESKMREVTAILSKYGIDVKFEKLALAEIQSDSLDEISKEKSKQAFSVIGSAVLIEDDGLFINALNGFPGPYSAYVFRTIGNKGILRLLENFNDRTAVFHAVIAYCDTHRLVLFPGEVKGQIADKITEGGWGYDPIFRPDGFDLTFGQMKADKQRLSHRRLALEKFAAEIQKWP